ncbi:CRISPR-associated endonuclease Cas1 [Commensalibacter sp. Nvir]|uniref:type II CRISPR-associated endonuclease Cas1 n=1 Tax=Commensalibacter sp. Nvir TaxID=3069817 RepID=UPI002D2E2A2A|nr:CRISPR-associated endonuclease Cas1 [Commensalibacter sp. Nvir]
MAWRTLHIGQPSRLSIKHNQLVIQQDEPVVVPLEDVGCIVLDTPQVTLTGAVLSACARHQIALIQSDETHHPAFMGLSFWGHYRQAYILAHQLAATLPFKKQLWQHIVRQKLTNQQLVLQACVKKTTVLPQLIKQVKPGDPENIEARGARLYWATLWDNFRRQDESDIRNALLNYGYAILRASLSRALVGAGLLPALGIHHVSMTNTFNLSDDLIEPFRPMVDHQVYTIVMHGGCETMTLGHRQQLTQILGHKVLFQGEALEIMGAIERTVDGLVRAYQEKNTKHLQLPLWIPQDE